MAKKTLYLVAAAKSRRIVGWEKTWYDRDAILREINRGAPGQYISGKVEIGKPTLTFKPADLVVPDQFRQEFRAVVDAMVPDYSGQRWK